MIMPTRYRLASVCAFTFALTACGGGGDTAAAPTTPAASTPAASDPAAEELAAEPDPTLCTEPDYAEENAEFCYGGGYAEAPLEEIPLGTPFEYADPDEPGMAETMTVQGVECGLTELDGAASNPAWDGSDDIPRVIPASAEPGMEFCRITATWENSGKKPIIGWNDFENLVTADGIEYAEDTVAEEATSSINYEGLSGCSPYLCSEINPGTPAFEVVKIYQVPTGTEPTAVQWPNATIASGPAVQFAVQ